MDRSPPPTRPPSLAGDPGYLVVQAAKGVQRLAAEAVAELDLRPPQLAVLIALDDLGPRSQRQLAERLDMDASHVVGVIDELAAAGLVRRERDPDDRRCHRLVVTDEGRALLPRIRDQVASWSQALVRTLDPKDRQQLVALLSRIVADLDRQRLGASAASGAEA